MCNSYSQDESNAEHMDAKSKLWDTEDQENMNTQ